jgi:dTDP-4-amino-4,6-dideoxygalactose transaminase
MTNIPLADLAAQYRSIRHEIDEALARVLNRASFIGGEEVVQFEKEFAVYCGVAACVGVGNGTDAIYLVLRAMGIQPGDEVITVSHTFIATCEAISLTGAEPVFVDVRPDTMLLDAFALERAVTPRTRAIIAVHLYGQPCDMDTVLAVANASGIPVIEDAAQAHGACWRGRRVGALGTAATFSFYPGKNLGAYGDAGAVVSNDADLVGRVRLLANHGRREKYRHETIGVNSRLDSLQAAVLRVKLRHLDEWNSRRREHAGRYLTGLTDAGVELPTVAAGADPVWHLFVIRSTRREQLQRELKAKGIDTGVHYPLAVHQQPAYAHLTSRGPLPNSERASAEVLSLPMYAELTDAEIDTICEAVRVQMHSHR